ncbi:MAG: lactate utilization protein C [Acidobacteriota bacterium]
MSEAREAILGRIRRSLQFAALPAPRGTTTPVPAKPTADRRGLADAFTRELQALGATVRRASHPAEAAAMTLSLAEEAGAAQVLAGEQDSALLQEVLSGLSSRRIEILNPVVPAEQPERRARLLELSRAAAGITGALAGLADTGSLVLLSGPRSPRLASLLPPVHIALVQAQDLYPSMQSFFEAHPDLAQRGSNLVFITGPSRTADIELILTLGVHGPKILQVVLLEE